MMNCEKRTLDLYWTVQRGQRFGVSLSEEAAWASLDGAWAYEDDPSDWSVEHTAETVPVAVGEIYEGGGGEMVVIDEVGNQIGTPVSYVPVKVIWTCPRCGNPHHTDRYEDKIGRGSPAPNPSIWFCEFGKGLVLVRW